MDPRIDPNQQSFLLPITTYEAGDPRIEPDSSPSDDNVSDVSFDDTVSSRHARSRMAEETVSDTRSLRESMYNYPVENGRTYHAYKAGMYMLPNDEMENERLDWQHYVLQIVMGERDFLAPLNEKIVRKVMDIGTGTGKWAIEFAKQFPKATVIGTDLSPIQPTENIPPNVHFLVDDANEEDWGNSKYDYIHTRMLLGAFEDFKAIIKRSFDYLEPGGWMESQEVYNIPFCSDGTLKPDNKYLEWTRKQDEAAMDLCRPLRIANKLKKWYEDCGFYEVHEEVFQLPVNGWPRDPRFKFLGKFWQKSLLDGLQAFSLAYFHRVFGWTREEIEAYLVPVREAISDRNVHAYHKVYVVWGRKPFPGETPPPPSSASQPRRESHPPPPSTSQSSRSFASRGI